MEESAVAEAAQHLVAAIATARRHFASRSFDGRLQAAAALVRCADLSRGAGESLGAGGGSVLSAVFARPLYEVWMTGVALRFESEELWPTLEHEYKRTLKALNDESGMDLEILASWAKDPDVPNPPKPEQMRGKVERHLSDEENSIGLLDLAYPLLYRNHSMHDLHGGAGPILMQVRSRENYFQVESDRGAGVDSLSQIRLSTHLVCVLAGLVAEDFGLPSLEQEAVRVRAMLTLPTQDPELDA